MNSRSHPRRPRRTRATPLAATRAVRTRTTLIAAVMVGLVGVAGAGMQSTSALLLSDTLDAHWRGAYDILVTAASPPQLSSDSASVVPDAASTAVGKATLSFAQLDAVRAVAGVAIAAPLGQLALPAAELVHPVTLRIPLDEPGTTPQPHVYAITAKITESGVSTTAHTVTHTSYYVIDRSTWLGYASEYPARLGTHTLRLRALSDDGAYQIGGDTDPQADYDFVYFDTDTTATSTGLGVVNVTLPVAPVQHGQVTLIDPEAEAQLLGDAGAFLKPLAAASTIIDRNIAPQRIDSATLTPTDDLTTLQNKGVLQNVSPLLARSDSAPDARLTVTMSQLSVDDVSLEPYLMAPYTPPTEPTIPPLPVDDFARAAPREKSPVTVFDGSVGAALSPFSAEGLTIDWPGTTAPAEPWYEKFPEFARGSTGLLGITALAPQVAPTTASATGDLLEGPVGFRDPYAFLRLNTDPAVPSSAAAVTATPTTAHDEPEYESLTAPARTLDADARALQKTPWSVGTYSADDIRSLLDPVSRVPLGYDTAAPTVISGSSSPTLAPALSGLGANPDAASAIADIANAATWGVENPISSVRVRVGGVSGYSDGAMQKILGVAQKIRALDLTATVVAGSSPQSVVSQLSTAGTVPTRTNPTSTDSTSTIAITRDWSELGAASSAQAGVARSTISALILAATAATALFVALQIGSIPGRRAQTVLMRQIGWSRRRRLRWMLMEEGVVAAVLVALTTIAVATASHRDVVLPLMTGAVLACLAVTAVAIAAGSGVARPSVKRMPRGRAFLLPVRSIPTFARRDALSQWSTSLTTFLATTIVSSAAALAVLLAHDASEVAGHSRLGTLALGQSFIPQAVLVLLAAIASFVLIAAARSRDASRTERLRVSMLGMGWTTANIAAGRAISLSVPTAAGALAAAVVVTVVARAQPTSIILLAVAALLAGAIATYLVSLGRGVRAFMPMRRRGAPAR